MAYSCSRCGLQYSRMWSLNRHMIKCLKPHLHPLTRSPERNDSPSGEEESSIIYKQEMKKRKRLGSDSADEESDTCSESSGKEECDENDHAVDYKSETETSDSEGEEDEDEIGMREDDKLETSINWPISRTYRITYPWSYWGKEPRIKKHVRWLERLNDVEHTTVMYNVQNASTSQIAALCEIAYNILKGHMPLEKWNWQELRKHRRAVRLLANPDVNVEEKREEILRRGANFVGILLHTINPLILLNITRNLKADSSQEADAEDDEEEEGSDEY